MKYLIVIPDGCADEPVEALDNRTPLQAAALPNIDKIVQRGIIGTSNNVPSTLLPASDVATLSLVGYDPLKVYTGRAPLETVAMHIPLGSNDWAIRCNLIHAPDGKMRDFTAGHISSEDGNALIRALQEQLGGREVAGGTIEFHPGVSYRNILVWRGHGDEAPFENTTTQAPHDVPDKPIAEHLPKGKGREVLIELMEASKPIFADHPANRNRDKPATQIWLWGQGKAPTVESFEKVYGKRGAIISAVDLVRGVGMLVGWKRIDVAGATGYLDTDYAAKGRAAIEALCEFDIVCVHVEAPDEASHEGLPHEKVKALERIDELIVGPLMEELPRHTDWRILVEPDHRTTLKSRAHAYGAVPYACAGIGINADGQSQYDEPTALNGSLHFDPGFELMRWFLG